MPGTREMLGHDLSPRDAVLPQSNAAAARAVAPGRGGNTIAERTTVVHMRQRQNYLSGVYSFGVRTSRIVLQVLLKKDVPYRFAGRGYGTPCPRACYQTILCGDSADETATEWKLPQAGVPRYKATRRPKRNPCKQSNSHHGPQIPFSPPQT